MNFNTDAERELYKVAIQEHLAWNRLRKVVTIYASDSPERKEADDDWRSKWVAFTQYQDEVTNESNTRRASDIMLAAYDSTDAFLAKQEG